MTSEKSTKFVTIKFVCFLRNIKKNEFKKEGDSSMVERSNLYPDIFGLNLGLSH